MSSVDWKSVKSYEDIRFEKIADGKATFDAHDLSTRLINLELRRLLYEEGVKDVTVLNPRAKHSIGVQELRG